MSTITSSRSCSGLFTRITTVAVLLLLPALQPAFAGDKPVTRETLLDRIRIEDLMTRYYVDLGPASGEEMAGYFTEDGILDVNGFVFKGREEIKEIYNDETGEEDRKHGVVHTLVTNQIVNVDGNTATIWLIWTNVMNDNIRLAPRFLEQGRDYTELVKRNGRWLITHRYVTTDGGAPDKWDDKYKPRSFR